MNDEGKARRCKKCLKKMEEDETGEVCAICLRRTANSSATNLKTRSFRRK